MDVLKARDGTEAHDDAKYFIDKMLIRNFLRTGTEQNKFHKSIVPKLEEEIEKDNYDWNRTKKVLKENVLNMKTGRKLLQIL